VLAASLIDSILKRLGVPRSDPSPQLLDALMSAYVQMVPWESASRIVKRADTPHTKDCPRWPTEFWESALENGTGGTCFESNYAFCALLSGLGFSPKFTINNMGQTVGCHTALLVNLSDQMWLIDAGFPLYLPLRVNPNRAESRQTPYMHYTVRPDGDQQYQIEREPHPKPNCFTLLATPVDEVTYRRATTNDYGPDGFFLDQVIISKVVQGHASRFSSMEKPYHLQTFINGQRIDAPITADVPQVVAHHFGIQEMIVRRALSQIDPDIVAGG